MTIGGVLIYRSRISVHSFIIIGLRHTNCAIMRTNSNRRTLITCRTSPSFALTLLSIVLPNVSNFRAYHHLQTGDTALNVVVLATHARRARGIRNLRVKTSSCIAGPFNVTRLLTHLRTLTHHLTTTGPTIDCLRHVRSNTFILSLHAHHLLRRSGPIRLARIRCRVVRLFFHGPKRPVAHKSVLQTI